MQTLELRSLFLKGLRNSCWARGCFTEGRTQASVLISFPGGDADERVFGHKCPDSGLSLRVLRTVLLSGLAVHAKQALAFDIHVSLEIRCSNEDVRLDTG